jgi:hypothetical protein
MAAFSTYIAVKIRTWSSPAQTQAPHASFEVVELQDSFMISTIKGLLLNSPLHEFVT